MANPLPRLLAKIQELAAPDQRCRGVEFTGKAHRELLWLDLLDEDDACDVLSNLSRQEFVRRFRSKRTGEWLYLFKVDVAGTLLYIKLLLQDKCVVISFHEDTDEHGEEDDGQ